MEQEHLERAEGLCETVLSSFQDRENGGFYLYGRDNETLILHPKETYDGAIPSGNSLMAWNLVRLSQLTSDSSYEAAAERQLAFLAPAAEQYPAGYAMFLLALLEHGDPPPKVTAVPAEQADTTRLPLAVPPNAVLLLREPSAEFPLKDGKTTFYVCQGHSCLPPVNDLCDVL